MFHRTSTNATLIPSVSKSNWLHIDIFWFVFSLLIQDWDDVVCKYLFIRSVVRIGHDDIKYNIQCSNS